MPKLFKNLLRGQGEGKGPLGIPYGPARNFLAEWKPFIPERPKVFAQELPPGITREVAIESLAASPWAVQWAEGMLKFTGVTPADPDYERRKKELARKVAERMWA
ncbi:MAG: hypothetical protein HWN51_00250 [Desulfobacterales bacterium]|nr:hypothetical protein [Desulfobacterales bacterium]